MVGKNHFFKHADHKDLDTGLKIFGIEKQHAG